MQWEELGEKAPNSPKVMTDTDVLDLFHQLISETGLTSKLQRLITDFY